jgi:hypothetical protein
MRGGVSRHGLVCHRLVWCCVDCGWRVADSGGAEWSGTEWGGMVVGVLLIDRDITVMAVSLDNRPFQAQLPISHVLYATCRDNASIATATHMTYNAQ